VHAAITAATGFLIAVLWFDLMFDVQLIGRRGHDGPDVDAAVESIATYYRRVTTDASPMGRLVGLVMVVLLALLVSQAVRDGAPAWVSISSLTAAGAAIILALGRVVRHAVRLGSRVDPPAARAELARGILRDHFVFLALMVGVLVVQLVGVT
jgi:hypothetical protein